MDWDHHQVTCPNGRTSVSWAPATDRHGNDVVNVKFATADCRTCTDRLRCTRSERARRLVTLRPKEQHLALLAARERQTSDAFACTYAAYAARAGVEGTVSQSVRRCGVRRARYVGLPKAHLQHLLTAAALNFVGVASWLADTPRAKTQQAPFLKVLASTA